MIYDFLRKTPILVPVRGIRHSVFYPEENFDDVEEKDEMMRVR